MPMMLSPISSPKPSLRGQVLDRQNYYGHPRRKATKCGHTLHPSAPTHVPWCPACVASLTRASLEAAQQKFVAEGGLTPPENLRSRRWNQARLKHEIMKRRLETVRKQDQLRWEREQAWDETHQQYDPQSAQAAAGVQSAADCPICASMVAPYPTNVPKMGVLKDVPWWERPGALAQEHILVPRAVPRKRRQPRPYAQGTKGSEALREIVGKLRASMHAADSHRRMWEIQYKTESAVRRKHSLDETFQFQPDFWNSPISGLVSRRNFQQIQDNQRMAERRARGNTPRPKPPRSSLSHSELSEELQVDKDWIETMKKKNEQEELEREARKVAQEIGYLYFVGAVDGMEEWKEDYLRSDRQLVIRKPVTISDSSESWDSDDDDVFDEMDLDE